MPCPPTQQFPSLPLSILMNFNKLMEIKSCSPSLSVMEREKQLIRLCYLPMHSTVKSEAVLAFFPHPPSTSIHMAKLLHVSARPAIHCNFQDQLGSSGIPSTVTWVVLYVHSWIYLIDTQSLSSLCVFTECSYKWMPSLQCSVTATLSPCVSHEQV